MSIARRQNSQSASRCNLAVRKSDEHTKYRLFGNQFVCYHPFLVVADKRYTEYERELTLRDREKQTVIG